jgi:hypothetical protein
MKFARLSLFVRRTHEKVRTLTCLARKLSLASRLERSNQTNNSRRWPSVPCFPWPLSFQTKSPELLEVGVGSVSLFRPA